MSFNILPIPEKITKTKTFGYRFPPGTSQQESPKNSYAGTASWKTRYELEERGERQLRKE